MQKSRTQNRRRVREIVEWSGGEAGADKSRNDRTLSESAARQAIARSESSPSKYPSSSSRKYRPGAKLGRPIAA